MYYNWGFANVQAEHFFRERNETSNILRCSDIYWTAKLYLFNVSRLFFVSDCKMSYFIIGEDFDFRKQHVDLSESRESVDFRPVFFEFSLRRM